MRWVVVDGDVGVEGDVVVDPGSVGVSFVPFSCAVSPELSMVVWLMGVVGVPE